LENPALLNASARILGFKQTPWDLRYIKRHAQTSGLLIVRRHGINYL